MFRLFSSNFGWIFIYIGIQRYVCYVCDSLHWAPATDLWTKHIHRWTIVYEFVKFNGKSGMYEQQQNIFGEIIDETYTYFICSGGGLFVTVIHESQRFYAITAITEMNTNNCA